MAKSFGQLQLEKFGWQSGNGLGKRLQGRVDPIAALLAKSEEKVKPAANDFVPWWEDLYNGSSSRLPKPAKRRSKPKKLPAKT